MKTETLRVRNVVDATRLGAWLRPGEGIGWLAAGTMPNSLYRMPVVYFFSGMCILLFLFLSLCRFRLFVFFFCSHWSLEDVPLISFCPADQVPDLQPRIVLGMVEARSVNAKKTTTTNSQHIYRQIIGCKDKTCSWHLNGFPDGSNIGSTVV